jgi:hypothetical protein
VLGRKEPSIASGTVFQAPGPPMVSIALQVYAGDEKGREIIATRIIDLARCGCLSRMR